MLSWCKIVVIDNIGNFSFMRFALFLKQQKKFNDEELGLVKECILLFKSYSTMDYALNMVQAMMLVNSGENIKAIVTDGYNAFNLNDRHFKSFRDRRWPKIDGINTFKSKLDIYSQQVQELVYRLSQAGVFVLETKIDHFYQENLFYKEKEHFYLSKKLLNKISYMSEARTFCTFYMFNRTYTDIFSSILEEKEIETNNSVYAVVKWTNTKPNLELFVYEYQLQNGYSFLLTQELFNLILLD